MPPKPPRPVDNARNEMRKIVRLLALVFVLVVLSACADQKGVPHALTTSCGAQCGSVKDEAGFRCIERCHLLEYRSYTP